MKPITSLSDRHLLTILATGKKNGARPFLRHVRVMIEVREEAIRRDLIPMDPETRHTINRVLDEMQVWRTE